MLDASVGGRQSNSYITLEEANVYFGNRLYSDSWDNAAEENKTKSLIWATTIIDRSFVWEGDKKDQKQALSFPRYGIYNYDGYDYDHTTIPTNAKNAVCEYALYLLGNNPNSDSPLDSGITEMTIDTISLKFDKNSILRGSDFDGNGIPTNIVSIMKDLIVRSTQSVGGRAVTLVRT